MDMMVVKGKLFGSQAEAQHAAATSAKYLQPLQEIYFSLPIFFNDGNKFIEEFTKMATTN
jgi:hypothetical protein